MVADQLPGFQRLEGILKSGVYALAYHGEVVYIGKSKELVRRLYEHRLAYLNFRAGKRRKVHPFSQAKAVLFDDILIRPCPMEELDAMEQALIAEFQPKINVKHKTPERVTKPISLVIKGRAFTINKPSETVRRL